MVLEQRTIGRFVEGPRDVTLHRACGANIDRFALRCEAWIQSLRKLVVSTFDGLWNKLLGFSATHVALNEGITVQREDDDMHCIVVRYYWRPTMATKRMKK
jgi:hypothetical protein